MIDYEELIKLIKLFKLQKDWVYLIHHMHPPKRVEDMEILHHCPLFSKKNLAGEEFSQKHALINNTLTHVIDTDDPTTVPRHLYDHLNNDFKIITKEYKNKKYAVITPNRLSDLRWSDQDRN